MADGGIDGCVFDIQLFSLHDGPGIRTTVFLKGCPLRCDWCHNPESWSQRPEVSYDPARCIGCGDCARVCPSGAHRRTDAGAHEFLRSKCTAFSGSSGLDARDSCGLCTEACPTLALELSGRRMKVDEVMAVVSGDRAFYVESGGGMTLSGGEPLTQPGFSAALLEAARDAGINTVVETSGFGDAEDVRGLGRLADLVLLDLKAEPAAYPKLTGGCYEQVKASFTALREAGGRLWLRLPLLGGVNDTDDHFRNVAHLASHACVECVQVIPYHRLGVEKRERFSRPKVAINSKTPSPADVEVWLERLRAVGVDACAVA